MKLHEIMTHVSDLEIWKTIPMANINEKVLVPFSGGLDSTVLIWHLLYRGYDVYPLSFADASMPATTPYVLQELLIDIGLAAKHIRVPIFDTARVTHNDDMNYIPGYKMIMQVSAMAHAEGLGATKVFMGYNIENGTYYDEHDTAIQIMQDAYNKVYSRSKVQVLSPYRNIERSQIVKLGSILEVPLHQTASCDKPIITPPQHCGCCKWCHYRWEAFKAANIPDYTYYLEAGRWQDNGKSPKQVMQERGTWFDGYVETSKVFDRVG